MTTNNTETDVDALAQERNHIAHELHDSLAQTLASVRYTIRNLDHAIQGGDECEMFEILEVLETNVEVANKELRHLISKFRAPLQEQRLIPAIEMAVEKFRLDCVINTVLQNRVGFIDVPVELTAEALRIVQEALANIKKHAKANNVRVLIDKDGDRYHILIEDDGIGFDVNQSDNNKKLNFGLNIMRERANRMGGSLDIDSANDEGTRVRLIFEALS